MFAFTWISNCPLIYWLYYVWERKMVQSVHRCGHRPSLDGQTQPRSCTLMFGGLIRSGTCNIHCPYWMTSHIGGSILEAGDYICLMWTQGMCLGTSNIQRSFKKSEIFHTRREKKNPNKFHSCQVYLESTLMEKSVLFKVQDCNIWFSRTPLVLIVKLLLQVHCVVSMKSAWV